VVRGCIPLASGFRAHLRHWVDSYLRPAVCIDSDSDDDEVVSGNMCIALGQLRRMRKACSTNPSCTVRVDLDALPSCGPRIIVGTSGTMVAATLVSMCRTYGGTTPVNPGPRPCIVATVSDTPFVSALQ
jgi:hypothetical protein